MILPQFTNPRAYRVWARCFQNAGKPRSVRVGLIIAQEMLRHHSIEDDLRHGRSLSKELAYEHLEKSQAILKALEVWALCPCQAHADICSRVAPSEEDLQRARFFGLWTVGPRNHLHVTSELLKVVHARGNFEQFVMRTLSYAAECGLSAEDLNELSWKAMDSVGLLVKKT